jgi:CheY-like chemotaxis protein
MYFSPSALQYIAKQTTIPIDLSFLGTSLLGCGPEMSDRSVRILVVEDEAVVLHTLQLILKQHGYDVRGARDGAEARTIAPEFSPNILLCDINLPDVNGIEISLAIKQSLPNCRIVLLSGEISSTELLEDAEQNGHHFEVLAKPTEPQQLLRVLAGPDGSHRGPTGIHRVK